MKSVVIRCDGSSKVGMGHLVRCLALARELASRSTRAVFAVHDGQEAITRIVAAGHEAVKLPVNYDPETLLDIARAHRAGLFFLDQRDGFSADDVSALGDAGFPVIVYDDLSDRRLAADLCIYPPIPQVAALDWRGFEGEILKGWDWVLLRPEFAGTPRRTVHRDPPRVLLTMGGADPDGFTFDALAAAQELSAPVTAVVGPMMAQADEIRAQAKVAGGKINVVSSPGNIVALMMEHDLALASFGVTAYELAACGVPMALWALTDDHRASATPFADAGIATVASHRGCLTPAEVSALVMPWIADATRRSRAATAAQALCDGNGVSRIADKLAELTDHRT